MDYSYLSFRINTQHFDIKNAIYLVIGATDKPCGDCLGC
jgi:hypothetical protein